MHIFFAVRGPPAGKLQFVFAGTSSVSRRNFLRLAKLSKADK